MVLNCENGVNVCKHETRYVNVGLASVGAVQPRVNPGSLSVYTRFGVAIFSIY